MKNYTKYPALDMFMIWTQDCGDLFCYHPAGCRIQLVTGQHAMQVDAMSSL